MSIRFISHFGLQVKSAPRILSLVSQFSVHTSTHHTFTPTDVRLSVHKPIPQPVSPCKIASFDSCLIFPFFPAVFFISLFHLCCFYSTAFFPVFSYFALYVFFCLTLPYTLSVSYIFIFCHANQYFDCVDVSVSIPHYSWLQTVQFSRHHK